VDRGYLAIERAPTLLRSGDLPTARRSARFALWVVDPGLDDQMLSEVDKPPGMSRLWHMARLAPRAGASSEQTRLNCFATLPFCWGRRRRLRRVAARRPTWVSKVIGIVADKLGM
jgi:hypothetical protein